MLDITESHYTRMFKSCPSISFDEKHKTKECVKNVQFDGFSWEENEKQAYRNGGDDEI